MKFIRYEETTYHFEDEAGNAFSVGRGNGVESITDAINAILSGFKSERISAIKSEAQERIYAIVPAWKQMNLLARSVELQGLLFGGGVWSQEQESEYALIEGIWREVKAVRAASNEAERRVGIAVSIEEIREIIF